MTDAKLKNLVAEAVVLDRQKAEIDKRLKKIKAQLIAEAEARDEDHVRTDGGGSSLRFDGADGCIATVSFPARSLKSSISGVGKTIDQIQKAAGRFFGQLFVQVPAWKPVVDFRLRADHYLGRAAPKLIKLCETDSAARVSFETADKAEVAE